MDLNRELYDNLIMAYNNSRKSKHFESAGIVFDTFKDNSLDIDVYDPNYDYEILYHKISDEALRVSNAAYDAGLDDIGNELSSFCDGIQSSLFITKRIYENK